jgi:hypothetical protein
MKKTKRWRLCKAVEKKFVELLSTLKKTQHFFPTKWSAHGEQPKQQEKNGKKVVGKNPWNFF